MKLSEGRREICWVLAIVCAAACTWGVYSLAQRLDVQTGSAALYLLDALARWTLMGIPALMVLYAKPQRWQRFRESLRPMSVCVAGYGALCAVSLTVVTALIAVLFRGALRALTGYEASASVLPEIKGALEWGAALLSMALTPALAEELLFRALIQGSFLRRWPRAGLWLTALIFAAAHRQWDVLPALFLCGLLLGYLYRQFGYFACVWLHALYNAAEIALSARHVSISVLMVVLCLAAFQFSVRGLIREAKTHEDDGHWV